MTPFGIKINGGLRVSEYILLVNRGIKTAYDINRFINASLEDLYDPFLMKDMDKGIELIKNAIEKNKKIAIYGDYDADGVTSTVILYKGLKRCGANFIYHIPDRENEGYGMNKDRIEKLKNEGVEVILSCDNGISAIDEIEFAKELGIEVVITDHHELGFVEKDEKREYILPKADATINPKRQDCTYPFKLLCGAGIAFKFIQALYSVMGISSKELYELLQYAAIGTVCDVVDLIDENRILVKNGIELLRDTNNIGLKYLIKETGINEKNLNSYHIGFVIGPCINATGRLETAKLSVELLLAEQDSKALELAKTLHELNQERQKLTSEGVESVREIIENSSIKNDKIIVVYNKNIHESIAGIVAGKIREEYNLPTIILTKGKEKAKGSGRSIEEYNMFEELIKCKDILESFGGHPMAAGLSIKEENIDKFREKLNNQCNLTEEDIIPKITIDEKLSPNNVSIDFINKLSILEPFGKGNSSPIFAEKKLEIDKILLLGKDRNTLKFIIKIDNIRKMEGICFGRGNEFEEMLKKNYGENYRFVMNNPKDIRMDFIFCPTINEYNGYVNPQMRIIDYRFSS
ncbi:exonuclease RecJ [Clostridium cochlearium]|uniref:Single-stranded-DNA-specific exonuclease RecJ n=1 Tax=Clostridium cochlearium TaxID=1494 RepID=A0ABY0QMR7_CLOCO|nr:single-stranded-DNA-specific exonuclease RecJ [Clostridium cochlearium]SDL29067.1 exonuclease RecJ [Clostridium cochlearium]